MLIGRFMGAVELSEIRAALKRALLAGIPAAAFAILWFLRGWDIARNYLPFIVLCWVLFQFSRGLAGRTLLIFSATITLLLLAAMAFGGRLAMWCVVAVGLFTSIGWPNIFSLALDGMGVYKSQVSSLLVMAILGGAILPPLQGHIADIAGLQVSYIVPLVAYAYVAFYGWKGHRVGGPRLPAPA
jgi:FHS family L-fucose permease-like MFS transporter